jgi:DNA-binding IclR family transcriptional regulator
MAENIEQKASEAVGPIERTLKALASVAERGEFTPKDIAADAGVPTSTAYRLLLSLAALNYVEKASHGSYRVGRQYIRLASLILDRFDYASVAHPFLVELSAQFQETCAFALYVPKAYAFTIIDIINSLHPLQYIVAMNTLRPLVWGALGRSMLPYLPEEEVQAAIDRQAAPPEPGTPPVTREMLAAEFDVIRSQGCFIATSPNALGSNGTAAAVFNARGQLLGSLGVTVPIVRYDAAMQPAISAAVVHAARAMSAALGYRGDARRGGEATV